MSDEPRCNEPRTGELLAAYQMGLLEEGERRQVERHLTGCSFCQELSYRDAPFTAIMRERPQTLVPVLDRVLGDRRPSGPRRWLEVLSTAWRPRVLVPVASVAMLIIAAIAIQWDGPEGPADLARIEALPYHLVDPRGDEDQALRQFRTGMEHYTREEYDLAGDELAAAASALAVDPRRRSEPQVWQARLYRGLSHLLADRPADALPSLREAMAAPLRPVADHARWYTAQALLVQKDTAGAADLLRQLATDSPVHGDDAREQLKALSRWLEVE